MIDFTPEAKRKFEEYLQRTRSSVRGSSSVEADEVAQNVAEHVELALAGVAGPVGTDRLVPVLEQLGAPEGWLSDDERPAWRRGMDRLSSSLIHGPEDWRLPYLSFGVTVLMIVFLPVGGILLLLPAFLLSRAYVELMADRGEPLGARRWLVLPPIALALLMVAGTVLIAPAAMLGAILSEIGLRDLGFEWTTRHHRMILFFGCLSIAAGAWWIVLAGLFAMLMRPFRALFAPITSGLRRAHAAVLLLAGSVLIGIGAILLNVF